MKLLIATNNKGKLAEYRRLLAHLKFDIISLQEANITLDVEETGTTFEANAILKAKTYAEIAGMLALADDSGLEVDALDGRPGVYSARYGTPGLDDAGRRAYLLDEMRAVPSEERGARFVCVIALHDPQTGRTTTVRGMCEGQILTVERDDGHGFGYDALFQPDGYQQTFAQLQPEVKNQISHRGQAVAQLPPILQSLQDGKTDTT